VHPSRSSRRSRTRLLPVVQRQRGRSGRERPAIRAAVPVHQPDTGVMSAGHERAGGHGARTTAVPGLRLSTVAAAGA
jgi:hypothetical protein